ncbi:MAG: AAA-like domain-containing protein [Oscillospiraceae bacterium]|nr:AAA-like domain-containing protein [Oscillospiraceae bacterium]
MRKFNVTGTCVPEEDYMVDISGKIEKITELVNGGCYFTINRARQYGKTTALLRLEKALHDDYIIASISFEGLGDNNFESQEKFCPALIELIYDALLFSSADEEYRNQWINDNITDFKKLSRYISYLCKNKKVVLMIDEVDRTSHNRVFIGFISMLREKFLARKANKGYTFHSVILAGVYDIKNIKLKMINEGLHTPTPTENKTYNSPWNIAVDFDVDMSFNPAEIQSMLNDYEADYSTGMNIAEISEEIYNYTSGYPFMVSRLCQCIDEKLNKNWTAEGVREAVNMLLFEANTLFDDMKKNIEAYPDLKKFLRELLFYGETKTFNIDNSTISLGFMFGYLKNENGTAKLSNKIFEHRIYNYFISEGENSDEVKIKPPHKTEVTENGKLNMELFLKKFAQHYAEIFRLRDAEFLERHGGLLFLTYLKPFINGHGFCHVESQTNDFRIDITVDYEGEQFIIELKIWHGAKAHEKAYSQLANYLEIKNAGTGYLVTFDFRKEANKERRAEWVEVDGKRIFDVIL